MFQIFRNFLRRQKSAQHQTTYEGYLPYFADDTFPLKWHKSISKSPSATACVSTIADFIEGFGFSDTDLENKIVNSDGETFFQIHQKIVKSFSEFEGFYIHFMFDGAGRMAEMRVFPFESCRFGKPDDRGLISKIFYNPFFGTDEYAANKKDTAIYDTFNLKGVKEQLLKEGAKFKGQILFVGTTTALSRFYPYPEAASAEEWMKVEAGTAAYHDDQLNNGLHQPYILVMKGDPNAPSNNPEYTSTEKPITVAQEFEEVMAHNFMGADQGSTVITQWVNTGVGQEVPEVIPLPSNANSDLFITLDNHATNKITVAFKVPAVLANITQGVSLGGDGNLIRVAVKLMQQRVIKKQRVLTDTYSMIFKNWAEPYLKPIAIVPYNPYPEMEVIDQKVWDELSTEARLKWIQENTDIDTLQKKTEQNQESLPAQSKLLNAIPVGFPESVRSIVKKAIEHDDRMGTKCGKPGPRLMAQKIIDNQPMGQKELKRIYNYLKKNANLGDTGFESCESVQYHQWGGKEMLDFLDKELTRLDAWLN